MTWAFGGGGDGGDGGGGEAAAALVGTEEVRDEAEEGNERVEVEFAREEERFGWFRCWVVGFHIMIS